MPEMQMTTNIQTLPDIKHVPSITIDAFLVSEDAINALASVASDRRMSKVRISYKGMGVSKASEYYGQNKTPNLLILEADADRPNLFEHLHRLASYCPANTNVIVIGPFNDISTYRMLMDQGVNDYLVNPVSEMDLLAAISKIYRNREKTKLGRISAFFGTRGGSGSSTIAHNVAAILSAMPTNNVLLIDVDYPFGTAAINLNIDNDMGAAEMLANQHKIDEGFLDRISVRYNKNLRVIGAGSNFEQVIPVGQKFVDDIVDAIHASACHAIIDLPTTWSERDASFLKAADDIILTATPCLSSMKNTKQLVEYCKKVRPNDDPPILVLNQMGIPKRPEINKHDFAAAVRLDPSITIGFDAACFGKAASNGRTIYESFPKSAASKALVDLTSMLTRNRAEAAEKSLRSIWGRLVKRVNE